MAFRPASFPIKDRFMRFAPPAAALSLALAVTSSVAFADTRDPSPRAGVLISEGREALAAGDTQRAIDAFEAALAVDPGYDPIFIDLAEASRKDGLQTKAIGYYQHVLSKDADNFDALAGEGAAFVELGAVSRAEVNLAKLQSLCGEQCPSTQALSTTIASAPAIRAEQMAAAQRKADAETPTDN